MKDVTLPSPAGISRVKLFLALSRTPHALLDMATPGVAALLWLGGFPDFHVLLLGLLTAFSGYTAVYALNDVKDFRVDREKIRVLDFSASRGDLDSIFVRHPLAQGFLRYSRGVFWMAAWGLLAMAGGYLLNPACMFIFLLACLLEVVYCSLLKITHLRGLISGLVKTSGPIAAAFAVDPKPAPAFLVLLFLWLFFWEIGGQNVPNDWADVEEDRKLKARTIPVQFGLRVSSRVVVATLFLTVSISMAIPWALPNRPGSVYWVGAFAAGVWLLLLPAWRLNAHGAAEDAFHLFNRASYYPLAMLLVTIISWFFES